MGAIPLETVAGGRMGNQDKLGLKDVPIQGRADEALGLKDYAAVLSEFVGHCDTPLTIALQGDWGSGKTSLMNVIKESLDEEGHYETVWFNTWQYAQFNMADTLALSMMAHFVDCLASPESSSAKYAKALLNVARGVVVGGASVIGHGDTIKTVIQEASEGQSPAAADPSRQISHLKDRITAIVKERVEKSDIDKVVVFIDDIDRLVPVKAIELLEALKVFLDIDRCVYIIACDYSVVMTGLKDKFGVDEGDLKGKSFFDKIIQVPFKMPIKRYKVDEYLGSLLAKVGIEANKKDIDMYRQLIESSIGFNPRTMKRMFNSLLLLTLLAKKEIADESQGDERSRARVLFGVLCMQEHYESLYDYIRGQNVNDELFRSLKKELEHADRFDDLRQKMTNVDFDRCEEFIRAFYQCLQLEDEGNDQHLSATEADHLKSIISLSAVVSAGTDEIEIDEGAWALNLRRELNVRYSANVPKKRPLIEKFRKTDREVYLNLPGERASGIYFSAWLEEEKLAFGLAGGSSEILASVDEHMRHQLDAVTELERDWTDCKAWWYRDHRQEEHFKENLYNVLDELLPKLWEICQSIPEEPE